MITNLELDTTEQSLNTSALRASDRYMLSGIAEQALRNSGVVPGELNGQGALELIQAEHLQEYPLIAAARQQIAANIATILSTSTSE